MTVCDMKKEVCIKCLTESYRDGWTADDDGFWSRGFVMCPSNHGAHPAASGTRRADTPPQGCRFYLEHVVLSQVQE